jgi:ribonuclease J
MRARIHRGATEIGGSCIELEAEGKRLLLDLGLPLESEELPQALLPDVSGLKESDQTLLGALISHPHQDHYGLLSAARGDLQVWMGEAGYRIIEAAAPFVPGGFVPAEPSFFKHREAFNVGPFTITPYLMDHSAFDSYGFLIEAEGKRLFYSGDFRGHGRKGAMMESLLRYPPERIDTLLMEGTIVSVRESGAFETEEALEARFVEAFKQTRGLALVYASSQNIDRVVSIFRAAKRTGRKLVIDLYTAEILRATGNENIPQSHWPDVQLYVPEAQRRHIVAKKLFDALDRHKKNDRIYLNKLSDADRAKMVFLFRPLMIRDLQENNALGGAQLFYSQWSGYLEKPYGEKMKAWAQEHGLGLTSIHTSGHADLNTLKALATVLAPERLVPIHTEDAARFGQHFGPTVTLQPDGSWWEV